jgi:hypothetical protein
MKADGAAVEAHPERPESRIDNDQEPMEAEIKTCLVDVEVTDLETNPEETETVAGQQEVTKEEAPVKTVRALKKRHGDRNLAVRHRRQLKKRTQGNGGSRKKLAAACRGVTRRAIPAQRKGHYCQVQGKDKAVSRTEKGRTFGKRHLAKPEGINGMRIQSLKEQLCLGKERISGRILRETLALEIEKRIAGSSVRIRKMNVRILWRGRPPPNRVLHSLSRHTTQQEGVLHS